MERKIREIFDDLPDTDVGKSVIEATVMKKMAEKTYEISDGTTATTLEIDQKFEDKISIGNTYKFYSPEKVSQDRLRLGKKSFPKKLNLENAGGTSALRLRDIVGRKNKSLVKDPLLVKVLQKMEPRVTDSGKQMR